MSIANLVEEADRNDAWAQVFCGEPPYTFRSKMSSSPNDSDLLEIFGYVMGHTSDHLASTRCEQITRGAMQAMLQPEGLLGVATFLFLNASLLAPNSRKLSFDLSLLTKELTHAIQAWKARIAGDTSETTREHNLILWYELLRISKLVVAEGGMPFIV